MEKLAADRRRHRSELNARMKFAEKFPGEQELSDAIREFEHMVPHHTRGTAGWPAGTEAADHGLYQRLVAVLDDLDRATPLTR